VKPRRIELHIQELVLHGFAPGDRYRIAEAMERELTRSFAETGAPPAWTNSVRLARVETGAVRIVSTNAEAVGSQVGQTLFRGLSK
jgi:hypothetical protein